MERITVATLVRVSLALRRFVDFIGKWGSFLILPLVLITMWDVFARKLVWIQIYMVETFGGIFASTILQELEWHFHTALFTLLLGYGYVNNNHVRVDLIREKLAFRKQAWIELIGCTFFMIPFCLVVIFFASKYAVDSFIMNEISASLVGLSHRWIIKTVMLFGLCVAALAGIAVWLQTVLVLFGPPELRFQLMTLEWPGEEKSKGFEISSREDADEQEAPAAAMPPEPRVAAASEPHG